MKARCFSFAVCGLAAAAFVACGDGDGGGSGGGGGSGASGSTGSGSTSATTSATSATAGSGSTSATTGSGSTSATTSATSATTGTGSEPQGGPLIDDMEDDDNAIADEGGRVGYWYVFHDETEGGQQVPAAGDPFTMTHLDPARGQSTIAACSQGSGFEDWGAGVGFDLNSSSGEKTAYDASGYTGIKFWAKVGPTSATAAKVMISDQSTAPEGGVCTTGCDDNWAKSLSLTEEWKEFTIPFAALAQGGWGDPAATDAIDASKIYSIQFQFNAVPGFDLCIDDITFY
ncbi:hypothetical protein [Sorangium sp. So ce1099]|uniref:hypothetical protein n=1 Tax=Sorangium sp. So ce1099 TaxID=3133331 RepID=UPI003F612B11